MFKNNDNPNQSQKLNPAGNFRHKNAMAKLALAPFVITDVYNYGYLYTNKWKQALRHSGQGNLTEREGSVQLTS